MIKRGLWEAPSWYLNGVLMGSQMKHHLAAGQSLGSTEKGELFAFSDYTVTLYKDACERYWHALIGDQPKAYVVCREESDDSEHDLGIEPLLVTCDYDEATAHAETDSLVLSCPIPGEMYRFMEAFVLEHYKPQPFKKRKRKKWLTEDEMARAGR